MKPGTKIKLDTEWLEDWGYTPEDIRTGDEWIWAINPKGEIVHFEKVDTVFRDSDDYPSQDDEIYRVKIERTFPFVYIEIVERLLR